MKLIWQERRTVAEYQNARVVDRGSYREILRTNVALQTFVQAWWHKETGTLRIDLHCQERRDYSEAYDWPHIDQMQVFGVVNPPRERVFRRVIAEIEAYTARVLECWADVGYDHGPLSDEELITAAEREAASSIRLAAADVPF